MGQACSEVSVHGEVPQHDGYCILPKLLQCVIIYVHVHVNKQVLEPGVMCMTLIICYRK